MCAGDGRHAIVAVEVMIYVVGGNVEKMLMSSPLNCMEYLCVASQLNEVDDPLLQGLGE